MNNSYIISTTVIIPLNSPYQSTPPVTGYQLPNFTCYTTLHIPGTGSTQKVQLCNNY